VRRYAKASFAGSVQGSGTRRGLLGLVCLCVLGLAAFLGSSAPSAGAQACPNEAFRSGPGAHLPDCRAYELVSPAEKEGYEIRSLHNDAAPDPISAPSGNTVVWGTESGAFGEVPSNAVVSDYMSRRGANWSSESIMPQIEPYGFIVAVFLEGFTEDLSKGITNTLRNRPPLTPDSSENSSQLFLRDNNTGSYRQLTVGQAPNLKETEPNARGLSADASHVVFESKTELTGCGGPSNEQLCDWSAATGALSLVGVLPGGGISTGAVTLAGENFRHPVSADGSRIFFKEVGGGECGVCVRINAATTQIVKETGTFQIASTDGSVAYVTDGGGLYRYDVNADALTPIVEPVDEVQGVLGASDDGSRVYLVAKGELAPGATPGANNLYLWTEGGGFEFIAEPVTLTSNWSLSAGSISSRVTPDGMHLAFTANTSLTGFPDNGKSQAYLYSAASGELVCASCVVAEPANGAFIEGGTPFTAQRVQRNLSDDGGRLFFSTKDALVPQDVNNVNDIYEYDAASGAVGLVSTGTDPQPVHFGDASATGNDLFFETREQLVGIDQDEGVDVYDARVGGGLASQSPPAQAPPCTGTGCLGESSSPSLAGAASVGFVGKGNLSQKQNCNKLGKEAKKLSNRSKQLRKNAKQAKRNGKAGLAKQRNKKANRLAKQARNKSKSAKKCRKRNRGASK
jgi:hypothetical protein